MFALSAVLELFGHSTDQNENWQDIVTKQQCSFTGKKCYKARKSIPEISIGTCTVAYGRPKEPAIICPIRLIEHRQIFVDCLHLLTQHEPGNELHIIPEVTIPGGHVDFFLVSARDGRVRDFVGIELQTLDTTGTVWPERQRLLRELGVPRYDNDENTEKNFGMNWKMTAKTILVQMHHKVQTFEHINKKIVLVVQDRLLNYMIREFNFGHLSNPASLGEASHFHAYSINKQPDRNFRLSLWGRLSTDSEGIRRCLGLQAEARVELEQIINSLQRKISHQTRFMPV